MMIYQLAFLMSTLCTWLLMLDLSSSSSPASPPPPCPSPSVGFDPLSNRIQCGYQSIMLLGNIEHTHWYVVRVLFTPVINPMLMERALTPSVIKYRKDTKAIRCQATMSVRIGMLSTDVADAKYGHKDHLSSSLQLKPLCC